MERMQNTLQDVLQVVSQFSGVDLRGVSPASAGGPGSMPGLDCENLKDKIRADLETFSATTATELSKQAEEKTRAALGTLENELNDQIQRVAGELREKLQGRMATEQAEIDVAQQSKDRVAHLVQAQTDEFARWVWLTCKGTEAPTPPQVQKLLEPYIDDATADVTASFQQKLQDLFAKHELVVQEKLQAAVQSLQGQFDSLEQASLQVCEQNADTVAKHSVEKLNSAADEVVKGLQGRIGDDVEGALAGFQAKLGETSAVAQTELQRDQDLWAENFRQRLDGMAKEAQEMGMSEISSRIAQSAADLIESSIQHLHHQTEDSLEHSRDEISAFMKLEMDGVQRQIHDMGMTVHQDLDRELAASSERHISGSSEKLEGIIEESLASMSERVRQAADLSSEEISRMIRESHDASASQFESRLQETVENRFNGLMGRIQQEADQAAQRVAAGAKTVSEALVRELSDKANASAAALREESDQASRRMESSLQESLEAHRQQLAQIVHAGLAEQKEAMSGNVTELRNRLKQAADLLIATVPEAR
jgi:Asp-tRNA(Asn)/Glu-tRNA(Gln) amidotransferase C subunit